MNANVLHLAFRALGDPTRRQILGILRDGAQNVTEISAHFTISRPAISQHLAVLHQTGLVTVEQHGTARRYATNPHRLRELCCSIGAMARRSATD